MSKPGYTGRRSVDIAPYVEDVAGLFGRAGGAVCDEVEEGGVGLAQRRVMPGMPGMPGSRIRAFRAR